RPRAARRSERHGGALPARTLNISFGDLMPLRPYLIISGDFVSTGGMDVAHLARSGREVHLVGYRAAQELTSKRNVIFHRVPKPLNAYTLGAPILGATG